MPHSTCHADASQHIPLHHAAEVVLLLVRHLRGQAAEDMMCYLVSRRNGSCKQSLENTGDTECMRMA